MDLKTKPKILVLTLAYNPQKGPDELLIKQATERLTDFEYLVLCNKYKSNLPEQEMIDGIKVYRLGKGSSLDKYLFPYRAFCLGRRLHKQEKFTFVWCLGARQIGLSAWLLNLFCHLPYLLSLVSAAAEKNKQLLFWHPFYRAVVRRAKLTQAVAKYLARNSKRAGNNGKIILIPSGIDSHIWQASLANDDKQVLRSQLGVALSETLLATTTSLSINNGLVDVFKAVNVLQYKLGVASKLLVLGQSKEMAKLKDLATNQGIIEQVIFLETDNQHDLARHLEIVDLFCWPAIQADASRACLEAMAVGALVVATDSGEAADWLKADETGLVCRANNPHDLAELIEKYTKDKKFYEHCRERGRKLVVANYTWEVVTSKLRELFKQAIG